MVLCRLSRGRQHLSVLVEACTILHDVLLLAPALLMLAITCYRMPAAIGCPDDADGTAADTSDDTAAEDDSASDTSDDTASEDDSATNESGSELEEELHACGEWQWVTAGWGRRRRIWSEFLEFLIDVPFVFCGLVTVLLVWRSDLLVRQLCDASRQEVNEMVV